MKETPFSKVLTSLETEADKAEFLKVAAEVGLGASDQELAKLLVALQLYKAYYATIPREIKASHKMALDEMRRLRSELQTCTDGAIAHAVEIERWAEQINQSIISIRPEMVAQIVQKRLLEDTLAVLNRPVQALVTAYGRIDTATSKLSQASLTVEANIYQWQMLTMRSVWWTAFALGFALALAGCMCAWLLAHG